MAAWCLLLAIAGCSGGGVPAGHALEVGHSSTLGIGTLRPGQEVGILFVDIRNVTRDPLTIDSAPVRGQGIGIVVAVLREELAPLTADWHAVAESGYGTDPPVNASSSGRCHVQVLRSVAGYRLLPGTEIRLWVVLKALAPGSYRVPFYTVFYTQDGARYSQVVAEGYAGSAAAHAARIPPDPVLEVPCLRFTRLLNP